MATEAQIRNSIQTKIFTPYGKSVTLKVQTNPVVDDHGDVITSNFVDSTITVVPYDIAQDTELLTRFGDISFGDIFMAVPYTVTLAVNNVIVLEGDNWEIKDIIPHYLPGNLVWVIRCSKIVS